MFSCLHPGPSISSSHNSTTWCLSCVIEGPFDTRRYFLIQARVGGYRSVSWTRRVAAGRPDSWTGWKLAILTHTLSPLTEVQQPPWLSAFPELLAQIHAWPRLINYAMDRPLESFSFKMKFPQQQLVLWAAFVQVMGHSKAPKLEYCPHNAKMSISYQSISSVFHQCITYDH